MARAKRSYGLNPGRLRTAAPSATGAAGRFSARADIQLGPGGRTSTLRPVKGVRGPGNVGSLGSKARNRADTPGIQ